MKDFKFIFHFIMKHKWKYLAGILTLFVVDYCNLFVPRITGVITDGLNGHTMDMNGVMRNIGYIVLIGLTLAVGRFLWRYFLFGSARHIQYELRNEMFAHLEKMSVEYYNEHKTGDLMSRFTNDLNAVRMAIGPAVISAFDASVMAIMVIGQMMIFVDVRLTLMAIVPMFFIALGEIYYGKIVHKRYTKRQEAFSELTDMVQESFSGVRVIKAFVQGKAERNAFHRANEYTMEQNLNVVRLQAVVMPLLDVIIGVSSLITLLYGGYLTLLGDITLGRFVAFNQYIAMLVWPMLAAGESITMLSQGGASIRRIREIFEEKPEIQDGEQVTDLEEYTGHIEFKNLTFIHKGQCEPTLKNITLDIPAGTTVAIIGRTGNGKSTLVNLLLHLYTTDCGMIFFDGKDINEIPLHTLRENVAYVPQDNFLFSDTLVANIAFGVKDQEDSVKNRFFTRHFAQGAKLPDAEKGMAINMEDVVQATKAACIHENIIEFPDGYETIVGERGVTLSGGQKQRSAIARAFMKNSPVLILDDALSAVDTATEESILQNLKKNRAGKTTILIAHRISTIIGADMILVLEKGTIAERGNHEELMALNGIYRSIYDQQQLDGRRDD